MIADFDLGEAVKVSWIPLRDLIVVRLDPVKAKVGDLHIPDDVQERPKCGTVVDVGPGRLNEDGTLRPMSVSAGDRVIFGPYAGIVVEELGEDFKVMRDDEPILVQRTGG